MFFGRSFQALVTGSGFRGLHVLLAGEGIVRRLYREERLQVRRARRAQAAPRRYVCVPKTRFCNIGDEGHQEQASM
jgi:hypothetical protein